MDFRRMSGILLHPTSFPGPFGIGDLGSEAYRFVKFLKKAKQQLWQILPLGPTGYGNSPYMCFYSIRRKQSAHQPGNLIGRRVITKRGSGRHPRIKEKDFGGTNDSKRPERKI